MSTASAPGAGQLRTTLTVLIAHAWMAVAVLAKVSHLLAVLGQRFSYSHAFVTADVATAARAFLWDGLWKLRFVPINNNPPLGLEPAAYLHWPPLTPALLSLWYRVAGVSEASTHAFSLMVAGVTAVALYWLAWKTLGKLAAPLAVIVWLYLPLTHLYVQMVSQQHLTVALCLVALACLATGDGCESRRRQWGAAALAMFGLAVVASWEAVMLAPGVYLAGRLMKNDWLRKQGIRFLVVAAATVAAILAVYGLSYPAKVSEWFQTALYRAGLRSGYGSTRAIHVPGYAPQLKLRELLTWPFQNLLHMYTPVVVAAMLFAILSAFDQRSRSARPRFTAILMAASVAWMLWYLFFLNHVSIHEFESVIVAPSAALGAAWCWSLLVEKGLQPGAGWLRMVAFWIWPWFAVSPMIDQARSSRAAKAPEPDKPAVATGLELKRVAPAGSVIMTQDYDAIPLYYSERHLIRLIGNSQAALAVLPRVQRAFAGHPVYVVATPGSEASFRGLLDDPQLPKIHGKGLVLVQLVDCAGGPATCHRTLGLLANGTFDAGVAGWDGAKGEIRPEPKGYRGACVEFRPKGTDQQYLISWGGAQLELGRSYRLRAWIRSSAGKPLKLEYGMWDATLSRWVGQQTFVATGEWQQATLNFRNDSPNVLSPIFWEVHDEYGPFQVDEVELTESGGK